MIGRTIEKFLAAAILVFTLTAIAWACSGCASFNAAQTTAKFEQSHGALTEDLTAVMNDIVDVLPGTSGVPRVHLLDAQNFIKLALANAAAETVAFDSLSKHDAEQTSLVKSLEASWLSYRQKHEILYSILIVLGCIVAYVLVMIVLNSAAPLSALEGVAGFIGTVAKWLFHILSMGFVALAKKLNTVVAAKVAAKADASPPAPKPVVTYINPPGTQDAPIGST